MEASRPQFRRLVRVGNYNFSRTILGKGTFCKVILGKHSILKAEVALKVLEINKVEDSYVKKNFEREAALMLHLNHPNVVSLHEVMKTKDFYCLVMDCLRGGTLCDLVQNQKDSLPEASVRTMFRQMATAVEYIHSRGVVHRDIKLENFLLDGTGKVLIADFGLSSAFREGEVLKTRCGSLEYVAPELLDRKQQYGKAVDVWSLGVCLYAMVTSELPFDAPADDAHDNAVWHLIQAGLTPQHMIKIESLSDQGKSVLENAMLVDQSARIKMIDLLGSDWFVAEEKDTQHIVKNLSRGEELKIVSELRDKLGLNNCSPQRILSYIKSRKGKLGKTAGCFSLLKKDYQVQEGMKIKSIEQKKKDYSNDHSNDQNILVKIQTKNREKDVDVLPLVKSEGVVKYPKTPLGTLQQSRRTGLQRKVIRSPSKSVLKKRKCDGKENEFNGEIFSLPLSTKAKS